MYTCGVFSFIAPFDAKIDLPHYAVTFGYRDENDGHKDPLHVQSDDEAVNKPYGDSWFSPQAHRNADQLKKEYDQLAKQYHPDCSTHPDSQSIFQNITSERTALLELIS